MPNTITRGGQSIYPTLVMGRAARSSVDTRVHKIIDNAHGHVSLAEGQPRTGTLELLFDTEPAAYTAFELHRGAAPLVFTDDERPIFSMTYVVVGEVSIDLDTETLEHWIVRVPFREVIT